MTLEFLDEPASRQDGIAAGLVGGTEQIGRDVRAETHHPRHYGADLAEAREQRGEVEPLVVKIHNHAAGAGGDVGCVSGSGSRAARREPE